MNTGRKGDFGALKAIQWFLHNGYEVFTPFSENTKHDLRKSKVNVFDKAFSWLDSVRDSVS